MRVPYHSRKKTAGPRALGLSSEREAEIDLGAIPDGVHEVVACNSEKCNEARGALTVSGLQSRVFFAA